MTGCNIPTLKAVRGAPRVAFIGGSSSEEARRGGPLRPSKDPRLNEAEVGSLLLLANPRLWWVGGHVSNIRACTHTCTHTPAEVTPSDPLTTLVAAFEVSGEGRGRADGGRDR